MTAALPQDECDPRYTQKMTHFKRKLTSGSSLALAIVSVVVLTAFANTHHGREPVLHFWSHFAYLPGLSLLIFASRNIWNPPTNRATTYARRVLVLGFAAGFVASVIGALSALPYALNANLKEISILSSIHGLDQPLLALGFLATIVGTLLSIMSATWFKFKSQPA